MEKEETNIINLFKKTDNLEPLKDKKKYKLNFSNEELEIIIETFADVIGLIRNSKYNKNIITDKEIEKYSKEVFALCDKFKNFYKERNKSCLEIIILTSREMIFLVAMFELLARGFCHGSYFVRFLRDLEISEKGKKNFK